jgi:hypothetical protein
VLTELHPVSFFDAQVGHAILGAPSRVRVPCFQEIEDALFVAIEN